MKKYRFIAIALGIVLAGALVYTVFFQAVTPNEKQPEQKLQAEFIPLLWHNKPKEH